jgi:histidine ammonia-lyase
MGACLDVIRHCAATLLIEANGVTDNPLVYPETGESLSGGNFHAEPVAFAADQLALAIAEIGALSERRIATAHRREHLGPSALPHLAQRRELRFMIAHVTAAGARVREQVARASRERGFAAHIGEPGDHVSMATFAARRLGEWRTTPPPSSRSSCSPPRKASISAGRCNPRSRWKRRTPSFARVAPHLEGDRYLALDIQAVTPLVREGHFAPFTEGLALSRA